MEGIDELGLQSEAEVAADGVDTVDATQNSEVCASKGCRVCAQPKFGRHAFCIIHKRVLEAMGRMYAVQAKTLDGKAQQKKWNELKNTDGLAGPPSQFASAVLEFERANPDRGKGKQNKFFDLVQFVDALSVTTRQKRGFKSLLMHKGWWIHHSTTVMQWPAADALAEWERVEVATPDDKKKYGGPGRTLELDMQVENFSIGENEVAHTKTLSKTAKKASNEDSLNEAQEALFKDHKRFTDTVFDGVGGHVAQRLARDGGTLIDSRGGGSFHVSPSTSQKREPMALEDAPAVEKKARVIEVDSFATKTELGLDKDYNILRAKCKDTLKKATEALLAAEQTDHKGQALERFVAILRQRKHLLEVVAAGSRVHSAVKAPDESSPIVKEEQDDQCGVIDVSSKSQKDLLCQMVVDCVADAENDELLREYIRVGLVLQFGTDQLVDSLRHVLETHKCLSPGPPIQRDQLIVDLKVAEVRGTSIDAEPLADDDPGGVANANPMDAFASKLDRLQGMSVRDEKYDAAVVAFSSHFSRVHGNLPASIVKTCEVVHGWNGLEFSELVDFSSLSRMVDKFRQARNSAALLKQELAARTAKKQPSMIADMEKLLTFVQIDAMRYDVNACQNEHEFKALKASAKDAKDLAIKFVAVVDRGIVDVKSCIKQGEAEFLKKQTAAGQPAKKKAKLNTPTKQGKATVPHVLVTERKHATFAQFASVEDFRQAIVDKTIDLDRGAPIHIVTTANIDAIVGDRSIKTLFGVFKAQFAGKTQEDPNDSKRGMTPVLHEKKTKLRELFLESTPPNRPVAENDRSSLGAMLQNVHFWGVAPCCPANASVERQCMAAVRYQASGERELVIVHASDVLDFTESLGLNIFEGLDEKSDVPSILADLVPKILHTNERIDEFLAIASKPLIYHAVVKPSSLIILPYGCIIVERILGDGVAAGIRVPFLDDGLKSKKNFKDLREMQAAYSKDNAKPDLLSKFWDQLAVAFGMDDVAVAT